MNANPDSEARINHLYSELEALHKGHTQLKSLVEGSGTRLHPGIMGLLEHAVETSIENAEAIKKFKWLVGGLALGGSLTGGGLVAALIKVWAG